MNDDQQDESPEDIDEREADEIINLQWHRSDFKRQSEIDDRL